MTTAGDWDGDHVLSAVRNPDDFDSAPPDDCLAAPRTVPAPDCDGPIQRGLNVVELVNAQSPITNDDLRRAAKAIATIRKVGPGFLSDFRGCVDHAKRDQRWREIQMTHQQIEAINDLAGLLAELYDVDAARAQVVAKEFVTGTNKTAVEFEIDRYVELAHQEFRKRRARERRNNPLPVPIGYLPPEDPPIVVEEARQVPAAVQLAQARRTKRGH
jgi:hypothetical protein